MKELSIEQKAKAYDEGIEKLRRYLDGFSDRISPRKDLEVIFPELRELEYEKIRKAILGLTYIDGIEPILTKCSITKQDIRAWLEKQAEQKPMKTCAEYYNKDKGLKMPELSVFQNKLADILMYREYDGPGETEDDIAKGRLEYELAAIRLSEELLPLAQKEQKPAWSEEDKKNLEKTIWYVENPAPMVVKDSMLVEWLKSLRPQKQWKPTEEQMNTLELAISDYENGGTYEILSGLLEQLKAL